MRSKIQNIFTIFILLASLITSAVANVKPANASADYGSSFITKGELLDKDGNVATNVGRYDQLLAHYDFEIPDSTAIKAGDTMTVTLPKQLVVAGGVSFELKDSAGNVIGTATVNSATGTVTVTFTDFYETHPNNKKGSFEVHTVWNQNEITVDTDVPLDWGSNGSTVHIGDDQGPDGNEGLYKWGSVDPNDPSLIHWTARVNRKKANIKNAVFTDTVGANQELVSGSIKAEYVTYTTGDNYTHDAPVPDSLVSENGTSGFTINFGDLDSTVLINYDTHATDNGASDTYENSAQLTGDNITSETVTVNTPHTGGSGSGSGDNQAVELTKSDADDAAKVLAGAHFKLVKVDESPNKVIKDDVVTDDSGKLRVEGLSSGDYEFIETKAPAGYDIDKTPVEFTIIKGQTAAVKVNKTNKLTPGSVILTKTDKKDGSLLQGAVFELQDKNGNVLQKGLTTDSTGTLEVKDLAPDDYQFVETKAPAGYDLDKTPVKFTIIKGQTSAISVEVTNQLTPGSVILTKKDADDGSVLQGAVFEIQDASGKVVKSGLTTDASGKLAVNDLTPGQYYFIETKAPIGYDLDKTSKEFTIKKGQTSATSVEMINQLTPGSVILTKKDADDGSVLQGAVFEIQDASGKVVKSGLTTDASGKLAVNDLKPGKYYFIETKAPAGYDLDKTPKEFKITKNQKGAVLIDMINARTPGSVILTKTDDKSGITLQGAVFELQDQNGKTLKTGLTTDASGKLAVNNLKPGTYQFVETKAPTGYDVDKTPVKVIIKKGQTAAYQVTKTDRLTPGSVILTKIDNKTGETLQGAVFELQNQNGKVLQSGLTTDTTGKIVINNLEPGAYQFVETKAPTGYDLDKAPVKVTVTKGQTAAAQVTKKDQLTPGSVILAKTDNKTGATLQGAIFELQDHKGKVLQSGLTTDITGQVVVKDLEPGAYQFVETKAPTGYDVDQTPVKFTIKKGQTSAIKVSKADQLTPGSVILAKTDDKTGATLQGATFELQDQNGKGLQSGLTTDVTGQVVVKDLEPGAYQFVETKAPTGYDLDQTPVKFTIKKGQTSAIKVTKADRLTPGSVILTKVNNKNGMTLQGAIFELQDQNGKVLQSNLTTDTTGQIAVKDLEPGEYQFVETKAPAGYQLDKAAVKFTIVKDQKTAIKVTKADKAIPGSVILTKQDDQTGTALAGAVFKIVDTNQKVVKENLKSNQNGQIIVTNLEPGQYSFIETKAPTGYVLDATPVQFTVKAQKQAVQVNKENKQKQHEVRLEKRDRATNQLLAGAVFELRDQKGKVLQSDLTTDKSGVLLLTNLKVGQYQLVETKAPTGYQLDNAPVHFTITKNQDSLTLIKYNVRQPGEPTTPTKPINPPTPTKPAKPGTKLPQTGTDTNNGLLYLGLELIMVVGLAYWQFNKKKHEQ